MIAQVPCEILLVLFDSTSSGKPEQKAKDSSTDMRQVLLGSGCLTLVQGTCIDVKNLIKLSESDEAKGSKVAPKKCLLLLKVVHNIFSLILQKRKYKVNVS